MVKPRTVGPATSSAPRKRSLVLLAAASAPLLLVAALLPRTFFDSDSGAKYLQARAIQGRAGWPKTIPYPGGALDPDGRYVSTCMRSEGNEAVSIFPVLFPIVAAAGLVAGQDVLWRLVPLAAGLLAVYFAGRLGAVAGSGAGAPALMPVCLLASPVFFYSLVFTEHTAAAAAVLAALTGLLWYGQFFFYSLGHVRMGTYEFSSWAIHMIMLVLFSSLMGLLLREWKGCRRVTQGMIGLAVLVLIAAVLALTYGNYLGDPAVPG